MNMTCARIARICLAVLAAAATAGATELCIPKRVQPRMTVTSVTTASGTQTFGHWRARYRMLKHGQLDLAALHQQAQAGATVPFWTASIKSPLDGATYTTSMIGSSPASKTNVDVSYVPVVVRVHFAGGVVLDPTKPACGDTVAISTRFFDSPLFRPVAVTSNGVNVASGAAGGAVQLVNGFQRANYWSTVKGSGYGVTLVAAGTPQIVDVDAPNGSSVAQVTIQCGGTSKTVPLGQIDINQYDALIQSIIAGRTTPAQLPIILTYNIVQTDSGDCCILGYHSAISTVSGTQTYAVGSYIDSGIFSGVDDIVVWTHELAEWMDDPFAQASVEGGGSNDLTPPWGHVGQVSGCADNVEVGDPLSGTEFALPGVNGFQYHTQDLAFVDWFYRTPARGTGGKYSFQGVFGSVQGACL
jgi:hypothetical protein